MADNNIDPFKNPFLIIDEEVLRAWRQEVPRERTLVRKHEFMIVSQTRNGPRSIVWIPSDDKDGFFPIRKNFLPMTGWEKVYVWDEGSARLVHNASEDPDYIYLVIDWEHGCSPPNIFISSEFIRQTFRQITDAFEEVFDEFETSLKLSFTHLMEHCLEPRTKPLCVWTKDGLVAGTP